MKVAVTGPWGNLGRVLIEKGAVSLSCDITERPKIEQALRRVKPDLIIHAAAETDVENCEVNSVRARQVNQWGTAYLRMLYDGPIIYISTDHITDGKRGPYTERVKPRPTNEYGWTKWGGEVAMNVDPHEQDKIVRTSKLFGGPLNSDFIWEPLRKLRSGESFKVTALIYRSFIFMDHFAECLLYIAENLNKIPKLINVAGTETISHYDFVLALAATFRLDKELIIPRTKRLTNAVPRPFKGGLKVGKAKRLGIPVRSHIEGLEAFKEKLG